MEKNKLLEMATNEFVENIPVLFKRYLTTALVEYRDECERNGAITLAFGERWHWKTKLCTSLPIWVMTIYGGVHLPRIQIMDANGKRHNITRWLLGLKEREKIPMQTRRKVAGVAAQCSFRAAKEICKVLGNIKVALGSVLKSVRMVANEIKNEPNLNEQQLYYIDTTGGHVAKAKKSVESGSLMQEHGDGTLHSVSVTCAKVHTGFYKLMESVALLWRGRENIPPIMFMFDGDIDVLNAVKRIKDKYGITIHLQRCLWHLKRSVHWVLWKDAEGDKKKDDGIRALEPEVSAELENILNDKNQEREYIIKRMRRLAAWCRLKGAHKMAKYFRRAAPHITTSRDLGMYATKRCKYKKGKTYKFPAFANSRIERSFRTTNYRIKRGRWWSANGSRDMMKLRLDCYYGGGGTTFNHPSLKRA